MPSAIDLLDRPRVLVAGGGYVGLYVALGLQQRIAGTGGIVTVVDPMPYMTYRPFLPEVAGGNIQARHAVVPLARNLRESEVVRGSVASVEHADRKAIIQLPGKEGTVEVPYEDIVIAAGSITRTFPIPGLAEHGIGIRTIEEAVAIRHRVLERIQFASRASDPRERRAALTFVVVGGGIGGVETVTQLEDLAREMLSGHSRVAQEEARFVLVEAMGRLMPEVGAEQARWVLGHLRGSGIEVLLSTSLAGAEGGLRVLPDLRVADEEGIVENAWAAGDVAAVPDLTGRGLPDGTCVPTAQHALRQGKLLAKNLWNARWDRPLEDYRHKNLGALAGFGPWKGMASIDLVGHVDLTGPLAWLAHRGYHGLAIPTAERKFRVGLDWLSALLVGRDNPPLENLDNPRAAFLAAAAPGPRPSGNSEAPAR
ncbi:NAD(P)/FAD-dependent oxidoreductase [Sinomonas atrocyanea]